MIHSIRGFNDIYGKESVIFQKLESLLREILKLWNFKEVRLPILEKTELFQRGIGDDTDIVEKEMYTFYDRNGESLTMRPEGTASVVRFLNEHKLYGSDRYLKFFYIGPMFRYERPQKGRLRQFHQAGIEIFGLPHPLAELEGISVLQYILSRIGITDTTFYINSLGCDLCRPGYKEALFSFFDNKEEHLCEDCKRRKIKNPLRLIDCKSTKCQENLEKAPKITDFLCNNCKNHFDELKNLLFLYNISFEENPKIVRGLDYYNRTVFEVHSKSLGAQSALCAGGRYDRLSKDLGGFDLPAFGWAMGIERLISLITDSSDYSEEIDFFVVIIGESAKKEGLTVIDRLRKAGYSVEYDTFFGSVKSQLRRADKLKAKKTIILGEDEIKRGVFILKDMKEGKEEVVEINKLWKGDFVKWSF
ncbi:MAG: histidine--tRNA ligase [Proteobacteria bacterium]|nr:histidine--tRNA ligase [Pseudomonadota bacterium]